MKILFFSHDENCNGGAQMSLLDLIKGLKAQNPSIHLYIIAPKNGTLIELASPYVEGYEIIESRWWMIPRCRSGFFKRLRLGKRLKQSYPKMVDYLRAIKPDLVVTNTMVVPQAAMVAKKLNVPHIWFIHEIPMLSWPDWRFIYSDQKILKRIEKLSSKVLVTSQFAKRYYQENFNCRNIEVIDQSVDIAQRSPKALTPRNDRYTILLVGQCEINKGQMELLGAVKLLVERGGDVCCYLVGAASDTPYKRECEKFIADHHLGHYIYIVPFTPNILEYYQKSDVLVNCSSMESFGRAAVEAQICGLPVVLSNVGANVERVIDGVNGFIYKKGDVEDLADKLDYLSDCEHRKEFSEKLGLLHLEKHTQAAFAQQFLQLADCTRD